MGFKDIDDLPIYWEDHILDFRNT